jgi:aminocarboxymuconate-semialdehyde decarboxylase
MTTSRRGFIGQAAGAAAGIAFTSCGLGHRAHAQGQGQGPARHRPVVINGKRVRTVDIHAHCHIPEATALMGGKEDPPSWVIGPDRIKLMDEEGIDVAALSINPNFWDNAERDLQAQVVKLQNEKLAELCAKTPDRFVGLASVALAHPDLAAEQLDTAVKKLGLRGALVGGSINGMELADPKLHPFWAKAEELGTLIFIHPQGGTELEKSGRLKGSGGLYNAIGNPVETTIALSHLILEGTLDRFPGLKICAAHAGGYLPSYPARMDAMCANRPDQCPVKLKKAKPSDYLKQLYFDSMVFTPEGLRHLVAEVGAGQIVIGTDTPFPWTKTPVDHIMETPGLSDADRIAMLGETAAKLLRLQA